MIESLEANEQSNAEAQTTLTDTNDKEILKTTTDVNENLINIKEATKDKKSLEKKNEPGFQTPIQPHLSSTKEKVEKKDETKLNIVVREMMVIKAIKALNDSNGSSVMEIRSYIGTKHGDNNGGVPKKKIAKILTKAVKQGFVVLKDGKYKLTGKGEKLGKKVSTQPTVELKDKEVKSKEAKATKVEKNTQKTKTETKAVKHDKPILKALDKQGHGSKQDMTTREMITSALRSVDAKKGMPHKQIVAYVERKYNLEGAKYADVIKKALKKGIQKKVFLNDNGNIKLKNKDNEKQHVVKKDKIETVNETNVKPANNIPNMKTGSNKDSEKSNLKEAAVINEEEEKNSMGSIVLNAIIDLERLTREGSSVGKIKETMVTKYKLDEGKFNKFLKDGIKQRGIKKAK